MAMRINSPKQTTFLSQSLFQLLFVGIGTLKKENQSCCRASVLKEEMRSACLMGLFPANQVESEQFENDIETVYQPGGALAVDR